MLPAELGDGKGTTRGELFTSFDQCTAPKFGHGLKPMPLHPSKEGPGSLTSNKPWSSKKGILIPRSSKQGLIAASELGPGQYEQPRIFDDATRRQHATMGLPPTNTVFTEKAIEAKTRTYQSVPEKVHKGTWRKADRLQTPLAKGPGPGSYNPCTTSFCACTHCGSVSQGVSFGTRPATYTGKVTWAPAPGPGNYHVDCTTLGAATRKCRDPTNRK